MSFRPPRGERSSNRPAILYPPRPTTSARPRARRALDGRAVVVRHRSDGADAGAILELTDPDATVASLYVSREGDDRSVVFASTSVGLYRVTLELEGL